MQTTINKLFVFVVTWGPDKNKKQGGKMSWLVGQRWNNQRPLRRPQG